MSFLRQSLDYLSLLVCQADVSGYINGVSLWLYAWFTVDQLHRYMLPSPFDWRWILPLTILQLFFYYETICIQPYLSIFLFSLMLLNSGAAAASLTVCTCCSSQRVWRPIPLFSWQLRSDNLNMTKMLQSRSDCYQLRGTKFRMFVQIHTLTHRRQLWHGGS